MTRHTPILLLLLGASVAGCAGADPPERATATLDCRPAGTGTAVPCSLTLEEPGTFRFELLEVDCIALETVVTITSPASVAGDVITDACAATPGQTWTFSDNGAPFAAGTVIDLVFTSDQFANPPEVRVTGDYPEWTVNFEDGFDVDFNDLVMLITAIPAT